MIIGVDLGTTMCKVVGMTADGWLLGSAGVPVRLGVPRAGRAEQLPEEVWAALVSAFQRLHAQLPGQPVTAIGISGAMHSLLAVSVDGAPLSPATTWIDNRAVPQASILKTNASWGELYQRTGCPVQAVYFPARLRWMQENQPHLFAQARYFVGIKDWIVYQLSGTWRTDSQIASATGLLNLSAIAWDELALQAAGISSERLLPVYPSRSVAGALQSSAARQLGLTPGIPIILGGSDGAMANLGSGAAAPGAMTITIGTSGAVRWVLPAPWLDPSARTWCYHLFDGLWFAGGAINNGGLAVQWVCDHFYPEGYERLFEEAGRIPAGAEGLVCLPYFTGERCPHWDPDLRAQFFGLGIEHSRAHIARAVLEGIGFCLADVWQVLSGAGASPPFIHLTGGITRSPEWMQILADILAIPLLPVEAADGSAVGAAQMAAWALSGEAAPLPWQPLTGVFVQPDAAKQRFYSDLHAQFQSRYQPSRQRRG